MNSLLRKSIGPSIAGLIALFLLVFQATAISDQYLALAVFLSLYVVSELNFIRLPRGKIISFGSPIIFTAVFLIHMEITLLVTVFGYLVSRAYLLFADALDRTNSNFLEIELYKNIWAVVSMSLFFNLTGMTYTSFPNILSQFAYLTVIGTGYFFVFSNIDYLLKIKFSRDRFYDYFVFLKHVYLLYVLYISFTVLMIILYSDFGLWAVIMLYLPLFMGKFSFVLYFNIKQSYLDIARAFSGMMDAHTLLKREQVEEKVELIMRVARRMGLRGSKLETLHYAAYLHDIGHFGIDEDSIDAEIDRVSGGKMHAETGADILGNIDYFESAALIVKHHHISYFDLKRNRDEEFYVSSQILKICCDIYEVLLTKKSRDVAEVIDFITTWSGSEYDPQIATTTIEELKVKNAA